MMNAERLGIFFREQRMAARMEVDQAAELLGIPDTDILIAYESGQRVIPLTFIFAMTNLYNISPDTIMALFYNFSFQNLKSSASTDAATPATAARSKS